MKIDIETYDSGTTRILGQTLLDIADYQEKMIASMPTRLSASSSACEAQKEQTGDSKSEPKVDVCDRFILKRNDHRKWADAFIEAGEITDQKVYDALNATQKKRVDEALAAPAGDTTPAGSTAQKDPPSAAEQRKTLDGLLNKVIAATEGNDDLQQKQVAAVRAHFTQILNEQGTKFEKPLPKLIDAANLTNAIAFIEKLLSGDSDDSSEDDGNPFA